MLKVIQSSQVSLTYAISMLFDVYKPAGEVEKTKLFIYLE